MATRIYAFETIAQERNPRRFDLAIDEGAWPQEWFVSGAPSRQLLRLIYRGDQQRVEIQEVFGSEQAALRGWATEQIQFRLRPAEGTDSPVISGPRAPSSTGFTDRGNVWFWTPSMAAALYTWVGANISDGERVVVEAWIPGFPPDAPGEVVREELRVAVGISFPDIPEWRFWSENEDAYAGGFTWAGGGRCVVRGSRSEAGIGGQTVDLTVALTGAGDREQAFALGAARVEATWWYHDPNENAWVRIPRRFIGRIQSASIQEGLLQIRAAAHPYERDVDDPLWTHDDHSERRPGDRAFELAARFAGRDFTINWPPTEAEQPGVSGPDTGPIPASNPPVWGTTSPVSFPTANSPPEIIDLAALLTPSRDVAVTAATSDTSVVVPSIDQTTLRLTLRPVGQGQAVVSLQARNVAGNRSPAVATISVSVLRESVVDVSIPVWTQPSSVTFDSPTAADQEITLSLTPASGVTIRATSSDTAKVVATVDSQTRLLTLSPVAEGSVVITLTARVGSGPEAVVSFAAFVGVQVVNTVAWGAIPAQSFASATAAAKTVDLDDYLTPNTGVNVAAPVSNNTDVCTVAYDAARKVLTITPTGEGSTTISLSAARTTGNTESSRTSITVRVESTAIMPTSPVSWTAIPNQSFASPQAPAKQVDLDDFLNPSTGVTVDAPRSNNPAVCTVAYNSSTKVLTITPAGPGSSTIALGARRDTGNTNTVPASITVTVTDIRVLAWGDLPRVDFASPTAAAKTVRLRQYLTPNTGVIVTALSRDTAVCTVALNNSTLALVITPVGAGSAEVALQASKQGESQVALASLAVAVESHVEVITSRVSATWPTKIISLSSRDSALGYWITGGRFRDSNYGSDTPTISGSNLATNAYWDSSTRAVRLRPGRTGIATIRVRWVENGVQTTITQRVRVVHGIYSRTVLLIGRVSRRTLPSGWRVLETGIISITESGGTATIRAVAAGETGIEEPASGGRSTLPRIRLYRVPAAAEIVPS